MATNILVDLRDLISLLGSDCAVVVRRGDPVDATPLIVLHKGALVPVSMYKKTIHIWEGY